MIRKQKSIDNIILVGDLHFGFKSNSHEWLGIMKHFFYSLFIPFLLHIKKKEKKNIHIVFFGDINDNKQLINTLIQDEQITIFEMIAEICPTHIFIGNHDSPFKDKIDVGSDDEKDKKFVNSCRSLGLIDNIQVYNEPHILEISNGEKVLLMPYQSDPAKELETINKFKADYLFAHTEIAGFHYEGIPVDESKHNKIADFKKFKKVYSGHIHKKQEKDNILFLGTPYHTRKNEIENEVGFYLIDFINGKEYWLENKISPKHKQINLFTLINMKISEANKYVENSFVDVVVSSNLMYKINFADITNVLEGYREIDHKTIAEKTDIDLSSLIGEDGLESLERIDISTKLPEYIDQLTTMKIGKYHVDVTDNIRIKLKETIMKLYKMAETKVGDEEIDIA